MKRLLIYLLLLIFVQNGYSQQAVRAVAQSQVSNSITFPDELENLFSLLWVGERSGNELIDERSGNDITVVGTITTDYIPEDCACTLSFPNIAGLKVDDGFDGLAYNDAGTVRSVTPTELLLNDYSRTLIKYSNEAPYRIEWIGLLDDAATPTSDQWDQLHTYFNLHPWWSGVFNVNGTVKDNRPLDGQGYKAWDAQLTALSLTHPSTATNTAINKLCIELNNAGVSMFDFDRFWLFMLNDASIVSGAGTVNIGNYGADRFSFPVAPTYTTSGWIGNGSTQYGSTNFDVSLDGYTYTQDAATRGMYKYNAGTSGGLDGYASSGSNGMFIGSSAAQRINSTNNLSGTFNTAGTGYLAMTRLDATNVSCYNETTKSDRTSTSTTLVSENLLVGRSVAAGYCNAGFSSYFLKGTTSQTHHGSIRTGIINYKTRLGL